MLPKLTLVALLLLVLNGCSDFQAKSPQPTKQPYQRFVPVPRQPENLQGVPWSGALALDTKTGQLCQTYPQTSDTTTSSSSLPPETAEEYLKQLSKDSERGWHAVPLCKQLYDTIPD